MPDLVHLGEKREVDETRGTDSDGGKKQISNRILSFNPGPLKETSVNDQNRHPGKTHWSGEEGDEFILERMILKFGGNI